MCLVFFSDKSRSAKGTGGQAVQDEQLVDLLYCGLGDQEAWNEFLGQLAKRLDAPWAAVLAIHASPCRHVFNFKFGIPPEAAYLYEQHYGSIDPWLEAYLKRNTKDWTGTGSSLCAASEFERTEFYTDFFRSYDVYHGCGTIVEGEGGSLTTLGALRQKSQPDFEQQHVELFKQLAPHLTRALKLHGKIVDLKDVATAAGNVLDTLDVGLVGLNGQGRVCFVNRLAEGILRAETVLRLHQGKISAHTAAGTSAWDRLWKHAIAPRFNPRHRSSIALSHGTESLHVTMVPFRGNDPLFPGRVRVLATITDPKADPKSRDQLLIALFGLTPAEARVAMLLVSGLGPREISQQTETTQNTVRFQLKVIYRKTGVSRQSQLVRLVSMLPGQFPDGDAGTSSSGKKLRFQALQHLNTRLIGQKSSLIKSLDQHSIVRK